MFSRVLADFVVVIHLAFIAFVVLGGLLALRWRWIPWLHIPAAFWGALLELRGWICPLTPFENWLRHNAGAAGYSGGFVEHYIIPIVYPAALTPNIQVSLAVFVCLANALIYFLVWLSRRRLEPRSRPDAF
ncbi:MAG: DUF2784 domain-containing protein [Gemmatimonadales bacterium]